jgi:hypothetical protein
MKSQPCEFFILGGAIVKDGAPAQKAAASMGGRTIIERQGVT